MFKIKFKKLHFFRTFLPQSSFNWMQKSSQSEDSQIRRPDDPMIQLISGKGGHDDEITRIFIDKTQMLRNIASTSNAGKK